MKRENNKSKKLVKVTYECLGGKFVEKPNGWCRHVIDNGGIVRGEWHKEWYEGVDEIQEDEVGKYLSVAKKLKTRRNIVVHH